MPKAVIMAGGPGERFWPLTHPGFPKYCIRLDGKESLLQKTYRRLSALYGKKDIYVVTTKAHLAIIRRELPGFPPSRMLTEPSRRNTAAAVLLAVSELSKKFGEGEVISFYPADHLIRNAGLFRAAMRGAIQTARRAETLVTVGIKPAFPATGYGYIQAGRPIARTAARAAERFHEKPARKTAAGYLKRKNFFWNAGIFTWRAGVFLSTLKEHAPQICRLFDPARPLRNYGKLPALSIDTALMEKADNVAVVATRMDWCDMGNWDMFFEKSRKDRSGNVALGAVRHTKCRGSLLVNQTRKAIALSGFKNRIFVKTDRGVLACGRGTSEEAARRAAREAA
ncbi:MAG: mannose-1-phosphate guanylyltransferase [Candidatus Omnitrophota bacterium]